MAIPLYKQAADSLRRLQGAPPYDTIENTHMACNTYALETSQEFKPNTILKARQLLDEELGQNHGDADPLSFTVDCGEQMLNWLTEQSKAKASEPKHAMVTPDKKPEPEAPVVDTAALTEACELLGCELPADPNARLFMWQELALLLKKVKNAEMIVRKELAGHFFPTAKEGTNTFELGHEWKLKDKHTINRKADESAFEAVFESLGDEFQKEDLFTFKPELKKAAYNKLSDKQRNIFDQCLIITNGSPALTIVPPKEK